MEKLNRSMEDEEDLEALRLAALQSLKKKSSSNNGAPSATLNDFGSQPFRYNVNNASRGKVYHNKRGFPYSPRGAKNGQFYHNPRVRNTNLISITPVGSGSPEQESTPSSTNKLTLPQDRFCPTDKAEDEDKSNDISSKFDRYNNSDKSEEETDDGEDKEETADESENEDVVKLTRSDSLEALMQELDDEIQGKTREKEEKAVKPKEVKRKKKKVQEKVIETSDNNKSDVKLAVEEVVIVHKDEVIEAKNEDSVNKEAVPSVVKEVVQDKTSDVKVVQSPPKKKFRPSPTNPRQPLYQRRTPNFVPHKNYPNNFNMPPVHYPPQMNPMYFPPQATTTTKFLDRPLSPLSINTDTLRTQTMAPLSPRSAAFVLQNRAIVEKRKRSPRRSYSKSPSPRLRSISPKSPKRRSLTPRRKSRSPIKRRSVSPRRRSTSPKVRKSISPRRKSISPRRKSISPRRKSISPRRNSISPRRKSISPRRRSISPRRRSISPRRRSLSPKRRSVSPRRNVPRKVNRPPTKSSTSRPHIKDRLGHKPPIKPEEKDSPKKKPAETIIEDPSPRIDEKPLDPVLEARKRKFESREITVREGVIRLKPKQEQMEAKKSEENEIVVEKIGEELQQVEQNEEVVMEDSKPEEKDSEDLLDAELNDDILLQDDDEFGAKLDDIFSDEDSGSENEGRFKAKADDPTTKPKILPFSKLNNGAKVVEKSITSVEDNPRRRREEIRPRRRGLVIKNDSKVRDNRELSLGVAKNDQYRSRVVVKGSEPRHPPEVPKRFERKIEIKIKNPSKYERESDEKLLQHGCENTADTKPSRLKFTSKDKEETRLEKVVQRKVEVDSKAVVKNRVDVVSDHEEEEEVLEDDDTEIIIENDSGDEENSMRNEGDLRAQLSKKRAEKLHKFLPTESVPSRLLQNALQGVVFKKLKKSKSKSRDLTNSDGKLPIHLRLGTPSHADVLFESKPKRKSRKRKHRDIDEEQVL